MKNRRLLGLLAVAVVFAAAQGSLRAADDAGFVKLFNGKDLTGLKVFPPAAESALSVKDGVLVVSGKPAGYFATDKSYKDYVLKFDWRYKRPDTLADDAKFGGNSGCLVHITGDHKVWPKCVEVQGMNRDHGNLLFLGTKGTGKKDAAAQKEAIKKVGEWNTTEIVSKDGKISVSINGKPVAEGSSDLKEGPIGWQSEGAEIHFRNIMIKEAK